MVPVYGPWWCAGLAKSWKILKKNIRGYVSHLEKEVHGPWSMVHGSARGEEL